MRWIGFVLILLLTATASAQTPLTTPIAGTQYLVTEVTVEAIGKTVSVSVQVLKTDGSVLYTISQRDTFANAGITDTTTIGQIRSGVVAYLKTKGIIN